MALPAWGRHLHIIIRRMFKRIESERRCLPLENARFSYTRGLVKSALSGEKNKDSRGGGGIDGHPMMQAKCRRWTQEEKKKKWPRACFADMERRAKGWPRVFLECAVRVPPGESMPRNGQDKHDAEESSYFFYSLSPFLFAGRIRTYVHPRGCNFLSFRSTTSEGNHWTLFKSSQLVRKWYINLSSNDKFFLKLWK